MYIVYMKYITDYTKAWMDGTLGERGRDLYLCVKYKVTWYMWCQAL